MNKGLKISVVICTYNRAAYITAALESLYSQTLPKDQFEVIVVNNRSTDNTKESCESYISAHGDANFFYYEELQQGASFARNTGAATAISPLLCFMDDDSIAEEHYLERIVRFFEEYSDAGGLGGRIIPKYIPSEPKWMSYYVSSLVGNFDYSDKVEIFRPGKYPLESNMVVLTDDFRTINGFSTALPGVVGTLRIGGEGKDLFFKLQALGRKIYYDPSIRVQHVVEVSRLTKKYLYNVASGIGRGERVRVLKISKAAFLEKAIEYFYKLAGSVILGMKYSLEGHPQKAWPVIQFRIDALKGLFNK